MTLKRRGFLQMLGGAAAAPILPPVSIAGAAATAPAAVTYPASAMHAAIYHAQSRFSVSVFGLMRVCGVDQAQAQALLGDLSARGVIGTVQGARASSLWASSNIMKRSFANAVAARKVALAKSVPGIEAPKPRLDRKLSDLMGEDGPEADQSPVQEADQVDLQPTDCDQLDAGSPDTLDTVNAAVETTGEAEQLRDDLTLDAPEATGEKTDQFDQTGV